MIFEVDYKSVSHRSQCSVCCIKERVSSDIISGLKPFPLEHSPKNLPKKIVYSDNREFEEFTMNYTIKNEVVTAIKSSTEMCTYEWK